MLSPSNPDDKQAHDAATASSSSFTWLNRAKNRLRAFNVLHGTRSKTSAHAAVGSPDSTSDSPPCFSSAVDLRTEATEHAVNDNAPQPLDLATASHNPSSTWFFQNRAVVGGESDQPRPCLRESKFPKLRSALHSTPMILAKRKLEARVGAECSSLNDLDDIDANNEKWKTYGSAYSGEQRLILLDEAAKRCPERDHADEDSNCVCPGLVSRSSSLRIGFARHGRGTPRIPHEEGRHSDGIRWVHEEGEEASSPFSASSERGSCSPSTKVQPFEVFEAELEGCGHGRRSKQWSSNAVADFTRNGSLSERASLREEQDLRARIASWDPSQEDGYALLMFDEVADVEGQKAPPDPTQQRECPTSERSSPAVRSSTAATPTPCSPCCESSSRKSSADRNLYDDLKWLTEGYESNPKNEILLGVDENQTISWSEPSSPSDGAAILAKMGDVVDSIASVSALSRDPPAPGPLPEATLSTFGTETEQHFSSETALHAAPRQSKTEGLDNSHARTAGVGQTIRGLQQVPPTPLFRGSKHDTRTTASDKDGNGRSDVPIFGGNSVPESVGVAQADERARNEIKRVDTSGSRVSRKTRNRHGGTDKKAEGARPNGGEHCGRDVSETAQPAASTVGKKEALSRIKESLRLADVQGASWDVALASSVKGTPLRANEFHSDDVNVKDSGEVTVCIRTSTRKKSAMVWPFGTTSASPSPSPPQ
ncbi:hypothetical protein HPB50_020915 [Hyalomma asiaticum]|uniref:Uncharacterized protein n=1 Tax=Hyalomma asiaticum TaxID=266040 RepID=A0ACB7SRY7_HYAAI|nr:hypothetical protein HPB50_020915 [Hyalomma asiaticum]